MKKRIAIVTPFGAEPRLDNYAEFILAQMLQKRGYEVRFFTYADRNNPLYRDGVYKGVHVYRCRQRFGISPRVFFALLFFRPHSVLTFHPRSFLTFTGFLAARAIRAKFISEIVGILHDPFVVKDVDDPRELIEPPALATRVRDIPILGWTNFVFHMPIAKADVVIAINHDEAAHVARLFGKTARVIYWSTPLARANAVAVHGVPDDFLLFIGQIKLRKGWDVALRCMAELQKRGHKQTLVFVTPNKDYTKAADYAASLGIEQNVVFLSAISNEQKQWLYEHAKAVLVPSTYEGFGLPVFEAFLAGKPVIATSIPVFEEFLSDRKNALLVPVGDGTRLAEAVERVIKDTRLYEDLVREGRLTAEKFSPERMTDEFEHLVR